MSPVTLKINDHFPKKILCSFLVLDTIQKYVTMFKLN